MGTYIMPQTQNCSVLARLAGVSLETWGERKQYKRIDRALHYLGMKGNWDTGEMDRELHQLVRKEAPGVYQLDEVLIFGVGKLRTRELAQFLDRCGDETRDPAKVAFILNQLGFELPVDVSPVELEGLYWG